MTKEILAIRIDDDMSVSVTMRADGKFAVRYAVDDAAWDIGLVMIYRDETDAVAYARLCAGLAA